LRGHHAARANSIGASPASFKEPKILDKSDLFCNAELFIVASHKFLDFHRPVHTMAIAATHNLASKDSQLNFRGATQ
jgi:hypothetical protein